MSSTPLSYKSSWLLLLSVNMDHMNVAVVVDGDDGEESRHYQGCRHQHQMMHPIVLLQWILVSLNQGQKEVDDGCTFVA